MCPTLAHVLRSLQETVRCTPTVAQMPLQELVRCTSLLAQVLLEQAANQPDDTNLTAPGRHAASAATPQNRGDSARASQAKPKCPAITDHRTACTVSPTSLTTQFQFSRQQIDDQVQEEFGSDSSSV